MLEFKVQPFCLGKGLILLLILVFSLTLSACSDAPVKIGFSGTLKGKYSDLGVQGRNGALLAVEEINDAGGLDGRKLELLVRDDLNTPGRRSQGGQGTCCPQGCPLFSDI